MITRIDLDRDDGRHYPGEVVTGTVDWSFPAVPLSAAVRLRWRTEGKSWPADSGLAGSQRFADLHAVDRRTFRLPLPEMPYSFSGLFLSIVWRVELVVRLRRLRSEKVEFFRVFTMSPTGDYIDPYRK